MQRYTFLLLILVITFGADAQMTAGLTGKPDTSYTTNSAYLSSRKAYPNIEVVKEFHSKTVREKRNISYCTLGERKLLLDAFYPSKKSKGKRTAIMIIYGGGWRSGNRTQHYPLAQHLADRGYVCFTPEYRLSTEALYPAAVYDLKAAIRWIHAHAKKYNIDTSRISVLGFSAGGELAAFIGATNGDTAFEKNPCHERYSSRVQAIVDLDGTLSFVHPESGEGDDSKKISAATYWFGYSKRDNPELWKAASPLTHAGPHTPPTLFINSSISRMHAGRDDFIKVLTAHHIFTEVKTFESSPHAFPLFHPWFEPMVNYVDEFLRTVFPPSK